MYLSEYFNDPRFACHFALAFKAHCCVLALFDLRGLMMPPLCRFPTRSIGDARRSPLPSLKLKLAHISAVLFIASYNHPYVSTNCSGTQLQQARQREQARLTVLWVPFDVHSA